MEFFLYLTPEAKQIIEQIYKTQFSINENIEFCKQHKTLFGYIDNPRKKFIICTTNIKNSELDLRFYINETVYHESTHIAHMCNGKKPFGISLSNMPLSKEKLNDIKNSLKVTKGNSYLIEHEAYWMEDKPDKVSYVLKKYCL